MPSYVDFIANDQGNRTMPSYVDFTNTERLIGDAAKNQVAMNPVNIVFDAKRLTNPQLWSLTKKKRKNLPLKRFHLWSSQRCVRLLKSTLVQ
ncbi:hypothetical protein VitviT2T_028659 [Vitis vinifera]|uniref:Uncharacterized protein n=1 Tax=Vitis vinifera TaxID=29760 RepID=A0ABY9DWW1_VITVI|nr:hypothetical protein VitviT2T_028659 [Vitis vinifera]